MPSENETPLSGGNTTAVSRAGETVRRSAGPWTPAVHSWLRHLEAISFDAAPRVLGMDDRGREILTFIHGDVLPDPPPGYVWSDEVLAGVASITRRLHAAASTFRLPLGAKWRRLPGAPDGRVICHNDIAPYNTVFREGLPVALIDWDLSAPGPAIWDLAWIAWQYVPLYDGPEVDRADRLRLLADCYGLEEREDFLECVLARQRCCLRTYDEWARDDAAYARMKAEGFRDGVLESMQWLRKRRPEFERALLAAS